MFKPGDRVKYIKKDIYRAEDIILKNIYTVVEVTIGGYISVKEDCYCLLYKPECFTSIKEERKNKLYNLQKL
jgi:hypothetical protein